MAKVTQRAEFIEALAKKMDITVEKATDLLEATSYVIEKNIRVKKKINLQGLGSFYAPTRELNKNGKTYKIKSPKFKESKSLREELNK